MFQIRFRPQQTTNKLGNSLTRQDRTIYITSLCNVITIIIIAVVVDVNVIVITIFIITVIIVVIKVFDMNSFI